LISAKFDGSCKVCGSEWKVGDQIHYSKDPKATCSDEECFKQQGGSTKPYFAKSSSGSFGKIYTRTTDDKVKDVSAFYDFIKSLNIVEEIEPYSLATILATVYNGSK
jgi:hypothetical protein